MAIDIATRHFCSMQLELQLVPIEVSTSRPPGAAVRGLRCKGLQTRSQLSCSILVQASRAIAFGLDPSLDRHGGHVSARAGRLQRCSDKRLQDGGRPIDRVRCRISAGDGRSSPHAYRVRGRSSTHSMLFDRHSMSACLAAAGPIRRLIVCRPLIALYADILQRVARLSTIVDRARCSESHRERR